MTDTIKITKPSKLSEIGIRSTDGNGEPVVVVQLDDEKPYNIVFDGADYIIVVAGATYPEAATRFEHPNVVAKQSRIHETRAYWPDGRKKWFSHAGVDYHFVIDKSDITLIPEKGYSYVPVEINGERYSFNVSGGTFDGWTDRVHRTAHVGIGCKVKTLKSLAEVALSVEEVHRRGITLDLTDLEDHQKRQFVEKVASYDVRKVLDSGNKIVLDDGVTFGGESKDHYIVEGKGLRQRRYIVWLGDPGHSSRGRIGYDDINYTKTAELNGIATVNPSGFNKIGAIKPYVPYHLRKEAV